MRQHFSNPFSIPVNGLMKGPSHFARTARVVLGQRSRSLRQDFVAQVCLRDVKHVAGLLERRIDLELAEFVSGRQTQTLVVGPLKQATPRDNTVAVAIAEVAVDGRAGRRKCLFRRTRRCRRPIEELLRS